MKLLWHSNAPFVPTGYGNQTGLFAPRLAKHYDLQISSFYGLEGKPIVYDGVTILPGLGGTYGNEALPHHVKRFFGEPRDGLVVTLMDVWVLDAAMCAQLNVACWVPVDHQPAPPGVIGFLQQSQAIPLAMSRFGMEQLAPFDPIYVPHGVDTNIYRPLDREASRERLGISPDAFLIGMVAANKGNPSRKSFVAVLEAFAAFRQRHENAVLYLHTDLEGTWTAGVDLTSVIGALGIPPTAVAAPDPYMIHFHPMSSESMATVYSSMDLLVNPATGEGFGIPVLEAQACGVPAIVTDFSAMREVCGAGWHIDGSRTWTSQRSWQMLPRVEDILDSMEHCYRLPAAERRKLSERARSHALQYDVERVMVDHMLPALETVQERLQDRSPRVLEVAA